MHFVIDFFNVIRQIEEKNCGTEKNPQKYIFTIFF